MAKKTKATKKKSAVKVSSVKRNASTSAMAAAVSQVSSSKSVTQTEQQMTPVSVLLTLFVSYFLAQSVIVYLGSLFFPNLIVLGTDSISPFMALMYSMFVQALVVIGALPVIETVAKMVSVKMTDMYWMVLYFIINILVLWMVARFAEVLGLGIASWMVVVAVAFVLNAAQGFITTTVMGKMMKK